MGECVTITVDVYPADVQAMAYGPLDYVLAVSEGKAEDGGSPMRLRAIWEAYCARPKEEEE